MVAGVRLGILKVVVVIGAEQISEAVDIEAEDIELGLTITVELCLAGGQLMAVAEGRGEGEQRKGAGEGQLMETGEEKVMEAGIRGREYGRMLVKLRLCWTRFSGSSCKQLCFFIYLFVQNRLKVFNRL